ncbi:MAG TPA: Hsp20/alpha crystallin family protein [Kiritimatiellia bacterium]|nr:Hsp20/alpha crystallin family protein [Kiritimatiellia bacterium]HMO99871.1 Hsp20/alpha crystallin family protein [Kiritimatiellia bacterium]HMP96742.1 Hsp20/alpha crystallin family protein [Kiritimatiellia bacterium]
MNDSVQKNETNTALETQGLPTVMPAVNLYEREHEVVIVADMPGVSEKNVDLTVEKHVLTISGKAEWMEPAGYELRYREFAPVEYRRVFSLTSDLDAEHITAAIKNGVLTVTLPKSEKAKPRKIAVSSAS